MAIKDIIAPGIGFSPGSVEYIVTRGFDIGAIAGIEPDRPTRAKGRAASLQQRGRSVSVNGGRGRATWYGRGRGRLA